jgi:O-antigen/teichoic acid export membrane protein
MSRTNRFLSGIGFGYASQVLTTMVGFWLTPFLLYRIGQHDYGLWLVGTQLMFYLALLDIGIVALLPRETAFATGRAAGNIEEATELPFIFGHTVRLILWQMPLVALGAVIAWFMMPANWENLRNPISVVLVAFVLTFPLRIFRAVLQGLQDLGYLGRTGIVIYLLSTGTTVFLVLAGWGLYALAIGWTLQQFAGAFTGWYRLRTRFPTVLPRGLPAMPWSTARTRLTQGGWVSLSQIAQVLLNGTDILIIGKLFGPAAVVPFVITGKLINVLANQPQMLMASAGPALSEMRMAEVKRLSGVCIALSQAMLLVSGAVVCVVLAVNQGFVIRWVGAGQYGGSWLTALILLSMLLRHWNLTIASALFFFGRERRLCITALLDGLVSVGAIFLFVREFGLIGAPLGGIAGVCLVSLPANLWALAHEGSLSVTRLLRPLLPWFARFVLLATVIVVLARVWIPHNFLLLGLTAAAVGTVYLAIMFPLTLRAPLGDYVRPRLFPIRARVFRVLRLGDAA